MNRSGCWKNSVQNFVNGHIETEYTGELVAVDTFFVGTLKGVRWIFFNQRSTAIHAIYLCTTTVKIKFYVRCRIFARA